MSRAVHVLDDRRRELVFHGPPKRVVSLVPSDTFNVFALGVGDRLVGRTDYCELPADALALPSVGGTKDARLEAILALAPELVLANQEENTKPLLESLAQAGVRVFVAFPRRVIDGVAHLARLARIFHVEREPHVRELISSGYQLASREPAPSKRVFCPIWKDPWMTANGDTYMSDVMRLQGFHNIFSDRERRYPLSADLDSAVVAKAPKERDVRYPRVTLEEILARAPEAVLLPDEPYSFLDVHGAIFRDHGICVQLVSGKELTWYGAMTVQSLGRSRHRRS